MQSFQESKFPIALIIADWNENIGPIIRFVYERHFPYNDFELISLNIFITYQNIVNDDSDKKTGESRNRENILFTLPLAGNNLLSRVLFNYIEDDEIRGGLRPYAVILLVPGYIGQMVLTTNDVNMFLMDISERYRLISKTEDFKTGKIPSGAFFGGYEDRIRNIIAILLGSLEFEPQIDENYSFISAIEEFKEGIDYYKKQNWDKAYLRIYRPYLIFKNENNEGLEVEALYLLGDISLKRHELGNALGFFTELEEIANKIKNKKYTEIARFMLAFLHYQMTNFSLALSYLEKLKGEKLRYIKGHRYYFILGKVHSKLFNHHNALDALRKSLELTMEAEESGKIKRERAQILYDIALQYYYLGMGAIKTSGYATKPVHLRRDSPNGSSKWDFEDALQNALEYFLSSATLWDDVGEMERAGKLYFIASQIGGLLGDFDIQSRYIKMSLNLFKRTAYGFYLERILRYYFSSLRLQGNLESLKGELIAILFDEDLVKILDKTFIAELHHELGKLLIEEDSVKEGLKQYIVAINLYGSIDKGNPRYISILEEILEIYKDLNDSESISYYDSLLKDAKRMMPSHSGRDTSLESGVFGPLKDIWFFTDTGLELVSIAPNMEFDPTLLGGFLTAIRSFSEEIRQGELRSIDMGNSTFYLYSMPGKNFFLLARTSKLMNEKRIYPILYKLYSRFYREYKDFLEHFAGNVAVFESFKKILSEMKEKKE